MKRIDDVLRRQRHQIAPAPSQSVPLPPQEPVCPICQGAGYLVPDVPVGHPLFGRLQRCECRSAQESLQSIEELLRMSNIEPFRDKSFATFDRKVPGVEKAFVAARDFARDPQGWLVLKGPYGCGKTHLAAAIGNEAIARHLPTLFSIVPDLLDHLRSAFGPSSEISYDEVFERVRGTNLLILDDLGTESSTPWAREKLFQILNFRYNSRMPTVITTNRSLDQIDERIVSRMRDRDLSVFIEISAGDYRMKERGERRLRTASRATGRTAI